MDIQNLKMWSKDEKVPQFCHACSRPLTAKPVFAFYDEETGNKVYHTELTCTGLFSCLRGHPTYMFDETGMETVSRW